MSIIAARRTGPSDARPHTGRATVALATILAAIVVGLLSLFASSAASAAPLLHAGNGVGVIAQTGGQGVGPHENIPAGQGRARAPNYDTSVVGHCVGAEEEGAATLKPYEGPGGGHHVPAKSAFLGDPAYDPNAALAIPNSELDALGVSHSAITGAQMTGYRAFAATGQTLTWSDVSTIETNALVRGGMSSGMAQATVDQAIQALQDSGVAGPTRIPWGG